MDKFILIVIIIFNTNLWGQDIITLKYDNTGLDYKGPELKTKGYSNNQYNFKNISIPTLQVFLPVGSTKATTAMVFCLRVEAYVLMLFFMRVLKWQKL